MIFSRTQGVWRYCLDSTIFCNQDNINPVKDHKARHCPIKSSATASCKRV